MKRFAIELRTDRDVGLELLPSGQYQLHVLHAATGRAVIVPLPFCQAMKMTRLGIPVTALETDL